MNPTTFFRVSIVASLVLGILGVCVDALVPGLIPPVLKEAQEAYEAAEEYSVPYILAMAVLALIMLIGGVAGTVGLYLFKPWGRWLSLWLSVLAVLLMPFLGPAVNSGWASMLEGASTMLWSAVLAMAYFSELNVRFRQTGTSDVPQEAREDKVR